MELQALSALGALRRQQIRSMQTTPVNAVSSSSQRSKASNSGAERTGFYLVLQKDERCVNKSSAHGFTG